jgi:hypothetical protein
VTHSVAPQREQSIEDRDRRQHRDGHDLQPRSWLSIDTEIE